jgi:hypothetical protein
LRSLSLLAANVYLQSPQEIQLFTTHTPNQGFKLAQAKMAKGNGRKTPLNKQKKHPKASEKLTKRERRCDTVLRDLHTYIPPITLSIDQLESQDPTRPFTTLPCQICEVANCGNQSPGHESPIVVDIRSKSKFPAACAIFFHAASAYNKTFLLHDVETNRRRIDVNTAIAALKQLCAYTLARTKKHAPPSKQPLGQIVIKATSEWLLNQFTARAFNQVSGFHNLQLEFNATVAELTMLNGGRPVLVKFWRSKGPTMAQQLADATLSGWEEAKVHFEDEG